MLFRKARQFASTYVSQIEKPMWHEVHIRAMAPSSDQEMRLERPRKSAKGGGFAMLRIREGIGAVAEALSHCQIEHVANLLARRAHTAAATSRYVLQGPCPEGCPMIVPALLINRRALW